MNNSEKSPEIIQVIAGDTRDATPITYLLSDGGQTKKLRSTMFGITLLVLIFVVWSLAANVDELARARGEVQPGGHVQVLQTRMGGTINRILVKEGDTVKAGQLLVDFSSTDFDKLDSQTKAKVAANEIDRERMMAILESRSPNFSKYTKNYPLLVEQAKVSYRAQIASREAALAAKRSEVGQQGSQLAGSERERKIVGRELREARERLNRLEEGARRGVVTKLALSDARQQLISLEERLDELKTRSESTTSTLSGADAEVRRLRAELNQQLSGELSKLTEQYHELLAEQNAVSSRLDRSDIRSPIDGIVMDLPQTAQGAVIPAGGTVAVVVPAGQELIMDVMVTPRDIGFVKTGQRASIKIDSFDSARFGSIEGKVRNVAPTSTKMKENGMPLYKVEIALSKPYVGNVKHRLIPGMTGEADIATGSKSVMQYLLKPIYLAADTAFHER
ncbi:MAG: HlyD family type I secretion periplasmic adaptor subunit [Trichlorobacter sp.]|uniref:HlyD family type I secretion periplasmic adaptor subunit n=1 Tax=Trichlorobacter sp. TaxID=2911007 RepID=UPI002565A0B2|nr:HlyD family type I secretion periplasmic adaptor subunit [Trichlorobacter sp.]MDK9716593.1 HlyD family type I secretion periplasmic adaptor subunit [Trichlorobacter sp.]